MREGEAGGGSEQNQNVLAGTATVAQVFNLGPPLRRSRTEDL